MDSLQTVYARRNKIRKKELFNGKPPELQQGGTSAAHYPVASLSGAAAAWTVRHADW